MPLPTDVAPGDPGHAALHNEVNEAVNALAADTGWRLLADAYGPDGTCDLYLRRVGATVYALLLGQVPEDYGGAVTLMAGFAYTGLPMIDGEYRLTGTYSGQGTVDSTPNTWVTVRAYDVSSTGVSFGGFYPYPGTDDGLIMLNRLRMEWLTDDAWPTTLPGTPYTP